MRALAVTTALLAYAPTAFSQSTWIDPRPPCDIGVEDARVNAAALSLKHAVENPYQRERLQTQTLEILTRSVAHDTQGQHPGAWYYLGRYYVERNDPAGADTAFDRAARLAPQCADDINDHRRRLWVHTFNAGVRAWQEAKQDSAVTLLRLAAEVAPSDGRAAPMVERVEEKDASDSVVHYLRRGAETAGSDTALARERGNALMEIARIYGRRAQRHPVSRQWDQVHASRDSLQRGIANDSIIMGRILAAAASHARGAPLSPADHEVFTRDSGARAQALARGREQRAALDQRAAADSAALAAAFAPAFEASEAVLAKNPFHRDALLDLTAAYIQIKDSAKALATARRLLDIDPLSGKALRLMAASWQLQRMPDSAAAYLRRADSSTVVDVSITRFATEGAQAVLGGTVNNRGAAPSTRFRLTVEFLDAAGTVLVRKTVDVPSIAAKERHPIEARAAAEGIHGWRYRPL